ncbi:MAG TPA: BrnT family toxin [Pseudolabrys sp.]|jgi:uncharacterized DUF497 family protein
MAVRYTFDPVKAAANRTAHGVDFAAAGAFDWETALVVEDDRRDYGERRYIALGRIRGRIHVMVFTPRGGTVRLISLRKANDREIRRYEQGEGG